MVGRITAPAVEVYSLAARTSETSRMRGMLAVRCAPVEVTV